MYKTTLKAQKGRKKYLGSSQVRGDTQRWQIPRLLLMFVAYFVKEVTVEVCEICLYLNIMEMTLAELVWC